jgi:plastocyanin domain-containing protein
MQKGIDTKLSIDLTDFDNINQSFSIINADIGAQVTSFKGEKGIVNVEFNIVNTGTYLIVQNNVVVGGIEVADSLKSVNLEEVRKKFIS